MRSPLGEGHDFVVDSVRCRKLSEVREQKRLCVASPECKAACYCLIFEMYTCIFAHSRAYHVLFLVFFWVPTKGM